MNSVSPRSRSAAMSATALLFVAVTASFVTPTVHYTIESCATKLDGTVIPVDAKFTDGSLEAKEVKIQCKGRQIEVGRCFPEEPFLAKNGRWYIIDCYPFKPPTISPSYTASVCHSPGLVGKASVASLPDVNIDVTFQCNEGGLTIKACKPAGFEKWIQANSKETITVASRELVFKCLETKEPNVMSKFVLDACRAIAALPVPVFGSPTEKVNVIFECYGSFEIKTCKPDRFTLKGAVKAGEGASFNLGTQYILCKKFDIPCIGAKSDCEKK